MADGSQNTPVPFRMEPISIGLGDLDTQAFDVIVVGSGYGGGVAASRLSRVGQKVCLLERGREILPGSYPNSITTAIAETQITTSKVGCLTPGKNGMLDMRVNDDISVIVGCGLGGTSLINANVSLPCDPRTFQDPRWPEVFRQDGLLEPFYDMARKMLGATPLPAQYNPYKLQALEASAKYMGAQFERPPINVTFKDGKNAAGVFQAACTMCGDCCSGCNYGAKNTTLMNYLPDAHKHGAVIVTEASVLTVLPAENGGWRVSVEDKSAPEGTTPIELTAQTVVLGAGTLGSTEILLRSSAAGLAVSKKRLGTGFSGNGDVLAFGFDANWKHAKKAEDRAPVYGIGAGTHVPSWDTPALVPGPCITGVIKVDMEPGKSGNKGLVIEEGVAPGALAMAYSAAFFMEEALHGDLFRYPDAQMRLMDIKGIGEAFQSGGDLAAMAYDGPISRTQTFLVMSHDSSDGVIEYDQNLDQVTVSWPGVGGSATYLHDNDVLRDACDGIWANYLENPVSLTPFGEQLVTVHPVGGCGMGDSAETGVVNDSCAVFIGDGANTHDGLYVCDGSVMPTSLGLNPLLTISAVSERAMSLLIKKKGWSGDAATAPASMKARGVPAEEPVSKPEPAAMDDTGPALLQTVVTQLDALRAQLRHIESLVKTDLHGAEVAARDMLDNLIDTFIHSAWKRMKAKGSLWLMLTEGEMKNDLGPAIVDILGVLDKVSDLLTPHGDSGSWMTRLEAVLSYLSDDVGDFSPEISFDETMSGHVALPTTGATSAISDPYAIGARYGAARKGGAMTANFRVVAPSAEKVLTDAGHTADLFGEVICPMLPSDTMVIKDGTGTFQLLKQDQHKVETWLMVYCCQLVPSDNPDGDPCYFHGEKTLHRRPGSDWWTDLTTLFVDVYEGSDDTGKQLARGIITLGMQELMAQAKTISTKFDNSGSETIVEDLFKDLLSGTLHEEIVKPEVRTKIVRRILSAVIAQVQPDTATKVEMAISMLFGKRLATFFAMLVFRSYGGFLAYMKNFPATDPDPGDRLPVAGDMLRKGSPLKVEGFIAKTSDGAELQLLRCKGGKKGPVVLAPGFATKASSFALRTVDRNFVEMLCDAEYDVWMLDYRGSPALGVTSLTDFTIDDVAQKDWPAAVDRVLEETGAEAVQIVAHCMGSMTCLMSLLCGALDKAKVKSVISSQLTPHPVTNWFNQMKSDTRVTSLIRNGLPEAMHGFVEQVAPSHAMAQLFFGMETINANSSAALPPIPGQKSRQEQDQMIDLLVWKAPFPNEEPCYSPTCHRVYGIYGPVYLHNQLNAATHDAIPDIFGEISTKPFIQIAEIMRQGKSVSASGADIYLPHHENLDLPITFIAGALNEEFLPDTSLRTFTWLNAKNPDSAQLYHRQVFQDYGHMDCFIGRNADKDIFPFIIDRLDTPVPK